MGRLLEPMRHLKAWDKMDNAKDVYDASVKEYWKTFGDYQKYWEIVYRTGPYIKLHAGAYERMFHVKSSNIGKKHVVLNGDSIEIIGRKCVMEENVTLNFPMTDDTELLSWTYEGKNGWYNDSDWVAFMVRGLNCKEIEKRN